MNLGWKRHNYQKRAAKQPAITTTTTSNTSSSSSMMQESGKEGAVSSTHSPPPLPSRHYSVITASEASSASCSSSTMHDDVAFDVRGGARESFATHAHSHSHSHSHAHSQSGDTFTRFEGRRGLAGSSKLTLSTSSSLALRRLRSVIHLIQQDKISKQDLLKNLDYTMTVLEEGIDMELKLNDNRKSTKNSMAASSTAGCPEPDCSFDKPDSSSHQHPPNQHSSSSTAHASNQKEGDTAQHHHHVHAEHHSNAAKFHQSVSMEVRNWIRTTFSQNDVNEGITFRNVAKLVRAEVSASKHGGSAVGNVRQNADEIPELIKVKLRAINNWTFDMFKFDQFTNKNALKYVAIELFRRNNLIEKFKIDPNVLVNFIDHMYVGYQKYKNPYHNSVHGADVAQTLNFILTHYNLKKSMTDLELFASIFSALIHDYEHTGTTNSFQVNIKSELALLYNDSTVQENHHVSAIFRMMQNSEHNIVSELTPEEFRHFRALSIDMILNTDMSRHFDQIERMKNQMQTESAIQKEAVLALLLHASDISHPAKEWDVHYKWTELLLEEFFLQGDREKELNLICSPLCDRKTTKMPESQVGFLDIIIIPTFKLITEMLHQVCNGENLSGNSTDHPAESEDAKSKNIDANSPPAEPVDNNSRNRNNSRVFLIANEPFNSSTDEIKEPWDDCIRDNRNRWESKLERTNAAI